MLTIRTLYWLHRINELSRARRRAGQPIHPERLARAARHACLRSFHP